MGGGQPDLRSGPSPELFFHPARMFNFSANHLFLLSRTEYRSCAVFLFEDHDTKRVYRLYDFTKALLIQPKVAYCVAGKVNSAATDRQTLPCDRIGPPRHQTHPAFHCS